MVLSYWILFVALSLSAVAAWYSIIGLAAIFSAAVIPIIIMGGFLEIAKVSVTIWLHEYWHRCRWAMKLYLVPAVAMLMLITSMGIFGFLSKAHTDQNLVSGDVIARIAVYDEKIKVEKDTIDANRKALKQLDEAVDQVMGRSTDERGAERAVQIRRSQQAERGRLLKEIEQSQKRITTLNEERAPIAAEVRKVEAEVGPIKYIAALVYGDNPDANLLERAVRWVIILLVAVFDPLAIMMVLAATESIKWERERRQEQEFAEGLARMHSTAQTLDAGGDLPREDTAQYPADDGPLTQQQLEQIQASVDLPYLQDGKNMFFRNLKPMPAVPEPTEITATWPPPSELWPFPKQPDSVKDQDDTEDGESEHEKAAMRAWKAANPDDTIKRQRSLFDAGRIDRLPWDTGDLVADNAPPSWSMRGFGTAWPDAPVKGDTFLRVDRLPSALYKFNGQAWIEIDKNLSDQYSYDAAYIDHLIAKIDSGEYDPELLTEAEIAQIQVRVDSRNDGA